MLTLLGAVLDVARVYQGWITLESATRDGAEYAATNATSTADALSDATGIICTQAAGLPGYVGTPGNPASCTQPAVTIVAFSQSATAPGANATYPIGTVTVRATLPFQTLFPYPLLTHDGAWTLSSTRTYAIVQGR